VVGVQAVKRNTLATLAAFPDRTLIGEDVIWSEDSPGRFHSSHRIASLMTHLGDDATFGAPTGRRALVHTIADCVCVENRIVEEWLVRDNGWLARQLGCSIREIANRQATHDQTADSLAHAWRIREIERVRARPNGFNTATAAMAHRFAEAWDAAFTTMMIGEAATIYAPAADICWPTGRRAFGPRGFVGFAVSMMSQLADAAFSIDHVAQTDLPDDEIATAVRWSLAGIHAGAGAWGATTGRELYVLGVSHCRWRSGRIIEERTIFDEIAIARQIAGGLGA
jgi:predicted ester cyclase